MTLLSHSIIKIQRLIFSLICLAILSSACNTNSAKQISLTPEPDLLTESSTPTSFVNPSTPAFEITPTTSSPSPSQTSIIPQISYDQSVLTFDQRERLYAVSKNFVAPTQLEGIQIAQDLNFIGDYGHPSNMCGPLAIGILRDAGMVNPYIDLGEFWNLNPREGMGDDVIERTFPRDEYDWFRTFTPIDQFDFTDYPLYTGDFLYIYAGDPGTFEHMLTVTKVDDQGRAYTTTNIRRENNQYLIEELLLYDPINPGEGLFYHWTDRENVDLGITGFGGFSLWRPMVSIPEITNVEVQLASAIDTVIEDSSGKWNIMVKKVDGPILYSRRADVRIHMASLTKVPIAALFFHVLEKQYGSEINIKKLQSSGTNGRTFDQLLNAMLVISEEEAAETLEDWVSEGEYPPKTLSDWGYPTTQLTPRRSTVQDIVAIFEDIYTGKYLSIDSRNILLNYLSTYTANDDTRLGVLRERLPVGSEFYNKRGSIAESRVIVADVAIVEINGSIYILALFAEPKQDDESTFESLDLAIADAGLAILEILWNYSSEQ